MLDNVGWLPGGWLLFLLGVCWVVLMKEGSFGLVASVSLFMQQPNSRQWPQLLVFWPSNKIQGTKPGNYLPDGASRVPDNQMKTSKSHRWTWKLASDDGPCTIQ